MFLKLKMYYHQDGKVHSRHIT